MPVSIDVRLKPRAARCSVKVRGPRSLEVAVTSPPVDNRANIQLIECLAGVLGVAKSSLAIIKGGHSRSKVVEAEGVDGGWVDEKLRGLSDGDG
ncbi:MAG: DUF167 domain-containing protein [Chitinispirillales bacterium]|nr:DUF167 domain-containing protein [Chitinispirillales bacterium]